MTDPMPSSSKEMHYKISVEPSIHQVLVHVGNDMTKFGVDVDDYLRAVWVFIMEKIDEYPVPPEWLWKELETRNGSAGER